MPVLFFSDLLTKVGLAPEKVKLIRHALSDKGFRSCYEKNMVLEYTRQQKPDFAAAIPTGPFLSATQETTLSFMHCIRSAPLCRTRRM